MNNVLITNIQRFSLHDGPGIRTTVFLKGCQLECPWCSNPESISPSIETYNLDGISGVYGKWISTDELVRECLKDKSFYESDNTARSQWSITKASDIDTLPGGVTLSGGECLLQMKELYPACKELNDLSIHIAVETSLFCPLDNLKLATSCVDLFYVDIKILNPERCLSVQKADLSIFQNNWEYLLSCSIPIIARIPVIGSYTDTNENMSEVVQLLHNNSSKILRIELLKEHNLAEKKYMSLGLTPDYHGVDDSTIEYYQSKLASTGIPTVIYKV